MAAFSDLLQELSELHLPAGQYAIFGSGPIAVRGLRDTDDLDILVTPEVFEELARDERFISGNVDGRANLKSDRIELWPTWFPGEWDVLKLIREAEMIQNAPFVRIEEVRKWKALMGRAKDQSDLKLIAQYLQG